MDNLVNLVSKHLNNNKTLENLILDNDNINQLMKINYSKYIPTLGSYSRNRLYHNDDFEILILAWDENSKTPLHNHPENGCILLLLEGNMIEERISDCATIYSKTIPGKCSYIDNTFGKHIITAKKKSWSLHIYSPPFYYDKK